MAPTIEQLEAMTDEEIRAKYNRMAVNVNEGLEWYREELRRRALDRQTGTLVKLTWFLAALTAANVVLVAVTTFD
jgi:hypothetical protein